MEDYIFGVICGILGGISNFTGQVLTKKAINDTPQEIRDTALMKSLVRNGIWLTGTILGMGLSAVFIILAQNLIGGALTPGLLASGFIVLAIGSAKILNEKLQATEIIAIILLVIAIVLIGLSELSIEGNTAYFEDINFTMRIIIYSIVFTGLWFGLYYIGRKTKRYKTILLAVGTGLPFAIGNIWLQPLLITIGPIFAGTADSIIWFFFIISAFVAIFANMLGMAHYQHALNSGNASIVVPVQQMPQQIIPILLFYAIYQLASPQVYSLPFVIIGVCLIIIASLILGKRQASFAKLNEEIEKKDQEGLIS